MAPTIARLLKVVIGLILGAALRAPGAETVAGTACAIALFMGSVAAQPQHLAEEWAQCHQAAYSQSHAVW